MATAEKTLRHVEKTARPVERAWRADAADESARRISALEEALRKRDETIRGLNQKLALIYASRTWRFAAVCSRHLNRLLPLGSFRRKLLGRSALGLLEFWRLLTGRDHIDRSAGSEGAYARWIAKNEPRAKDFARQRKTRFPRSPLISIVVPVHETPPEFLRAMLDSVLAQSYENWELCLADGASTDAEVGSLLKEYARRDSRIRLALLPENRGIAGNSRAALELAQGEYVAFLDHDDTLAPFALFEVVRALNLQPDLDFIYSDEDHITEKGDRQNPHFKPDWSPETLLSHNYICHLTIVRRDLLAKVGGLRDGFDGSQDYDLALRATAQAAHIHHIRQILYHWRQHPASLSNGPSKDQPQEAGKKAIREHLARQSIEGTVADGPVAGAYDVRRSLGRRPLVSIIIPTQDHVDVLARCLDSIARSTYARYEVLLIENQSRRPETFDYYRAIERRPEVRLVPWDHRFNYSELNNFAAAQAGGEMLLLLNNDIEVQSADWLERMLEHALRPEVGAVGAKLYYPDGDVQHAGVIVGIRGVAGHAHRFAPPSSAGYFHRLVVTQNLSAVTAACLMLRKEVFREIGGFDERFAVAFNDVDLCMRVRRRGYWIVWTPYAELTHYESRTRGPEDSTEKLWRAEQEANLFIETWRDELQKGDPFYSPHLTLSSEDFALRI
jgi:GT2 family glycosyltransferase